MQTPIVKKAVRLFSFVLGVLILTSCGDSSTDVQLTSTSEYTCTATIDTYPDIMISAKSREALDEFLDVVTNAEIDNILGIDGKNPQENLSD